MDFYRSVFGGELTISTFGEMSASQDPAEQEKVMHADLTTPGGIRLMASDTPSSIEVAEGSSISVSLSGDDEAELRGYWDALSDGATILEPLVLAPWGDWFGMLVDRFGVRWLVNIAGAGPQS